MTISFNYRFTKFLIGLAFVKLVYSQNCEQVNNYKVIQPNAKFLFGGHCYSNSEDLSKNLCAGEGLEIAEITTATDQLSIFKTWADRNKFYAIGHKQNLDVGLGVVVNLRNQTSKFTYFGLDEPNNNGVEGNPPTEKIEECIIAKNVWVDVPCEQHNNDRSICTLCQFPRDSDCYKSSREERINSQYGDTDGMDPYLNTPVNHAVFNNRLYQKTFAEAKFVCKTFGMDLPDIESDNGKSEDLHAGWNLFLKKTGFIKDITMWTKSSMNSTSGLCRPYNLKNNQAIPHKFELSCDSHSFHLCVLPCTTPKGRRLSTGGLV